MTGRRRIAGSRDHLKERKSTTIITMMTMTTRRPTVLLETFLTERTELTRRPFELLYYSVRGDHGVL